MDKSKESKKEVKPKKIVPNEEFEKWMALGFRIIKRGGRR
jgi:hypothetical protein